MIAPIGICASVTRNAPSAASCAPRGSPSTLRAASQVTSVSARPTSATSAVPELDERVEALLGIRLVAAARPVLAAEPGPGQPHERARGHDEEERGAGREREPEEAGGRQAPEAKARDRRRSRAEHDSGARLDRPIRDRSSPRTRTSPRGPRRARRAARRGARRPSAGRTRALRAPASPRSRRGARRTRGSGGRRPCCTPASASSAAPGSSGSAPASSTTRTPLRDASSCACPSSPNPVTSVTAFGSNGRRTSAARRLSSTIDSIAASSAPGGATPSRCAWRTIPVPSGFVR